MPKITKRAVDTIVPAERERIVWDDDIKGFGVRVHPTGRKVYIVKCRHERRSVKSPSVRTDPSPRPPRVPKPQKSSHSQRQAVM